MSPERSVKDLFGPYSEKLVEPMGFEPTTSSMPSRRAPNCATAPPGRFSDVSIRAADSSMMARKAGVVRKPDVESAMKPKFGLQVGPMRTLTAGCLFLRSLGIRWLPPGQ